ncbi:hypothetical protein XENOCAPTIV_019335, partial [Xenoophorus captivus]
LFHTPKPKSWKTQPAREEQQPGANKLIGARWRFSPAAETVVSGKRVGLTVGQREKSAHICDYHFPRTSAGSSLLERVVEELGQPDGQRFWPVFFFFFFCIYRAVTRRSPLTSGRRPLWITASLWCDGPNRNCCGGTRRSLLLLDWIGGIPPA